MNILLYWPVFILLIFEFVLFWFWLNLRIFDNFCNSLCEWMMDHYLHLHDFTECGFVSQFSLFSPLAIYFFFLVINDSTFCLFICLFIYVIYELRVAIYIVWVIARNKHLKVLPATKLKIHYVLSVAAI